MTDILTDQPKLLTQDEAALLLGVSVSTFKRIAHRDSIPFFTVGRRRKFDRVDLVTYLQGQRTIPSGPSTNLAEPISPAKSPKRPAPSALSEIVNRPGRRLQTSFTAKVPRQKS